MKRLYFQVHQPELAGEPDAASEDIIEQGREVGLLARQMFPGGVEITSEGGLDRAIRTTRELVANPQIPAIFEGVFEHEVGEPRGLLIHSVTVPTCSVMVQQGRNRVDWEATCFPILGRRIARSVDGVRGYEFSQPLPGDR